jgi:hypothetical protein
MLSFLPITVLALALSSTISAQHVTVQGVRDGNGPNGKRPARLNIRSLQADTYAWYVPS